LVTDAISATSLGPGEYTLGGLEILVEQSVPASFEIDLDGYVAKLSDRSAFAGSVSTMDHLVRHLVESVGVPLIDAVRMATINPGRVLGRYDIGVLQPEASGDMVIFDNSFTIMMTVVGGRIVYKNPAFEGITFKEEGKLK
jgi:N-acetylglucosamine-6-phosphate deacetylase